MTDEKDLINNYTFNDKIINEGLFERFFCIFEL